MSGAPLRRPYEPRTAAGFTYIGLLMMVAAISLAATASVQVGGVMQRRAAEQELIFVGLQFKNAIRSYFERAPLGIPSSAPPNFAALLRDPRYPSPTRHLRQVYIDPMTGTTDWGIIHGLDGGVIGVYSKSTAKPIRVANFPDELFHFKSAKGFKDWVFVYGVVCQDSGCELPPQPGESTIDREFGKLPMQQMTRPSTHTNLGR